MLLITMKKIITINLMHQEGLMDIKRVCLVFALAVSGCGLALPPIVVTNGLANACTKCVPRSCVRHNGIPSPRPQFIEREASALRKERIE